MKIRFYLKNGSILPDLECDDFNASYNKTTGELAKYSYEGAAGPRPLYVDISDSSAIVIKEN